MHKFFKPFIALSVLAAFTLSTILCCCTMHLTQNSSMKSMGVMASIPCSCHKDSAPKKTMDHGYCFMKAPWAEKAQLSAVAAPNFQKVIQFSNTLIATQRYLPRDVFIKTAYRGVLFQAPPVPLYLKIHNLRL
jgi:hypothetical protein